MSADIASQLAKPGDADLDLDVDGVTLTEVVVCGHELILTFAGGFGAFVATTGEVAEFPPGDDTASLTDATMNVGYRDPDPEWFAKVVERLDGWRASATPLRICSAPGKMTTVIEDRSTWLPFPRRPPSAD